MAKTPKNVIEIDRLRQRQLQAKLINHIASVYFFFNSEDEDFEETDIDDFILDNWDNAILTAAVLGLRVVGETEDGRIVAELKPVESVKKFFIDGKWGDEENTYLEEVDEEDVTSAPADIDWGDFSEIFE
jgi:hypothetical protein